MPNTYLDRMLTHAVYFERYKTHEVNQLLKVLDAANVACKSEVSKTDGAATKARYVEIMKKIGQIRDEAVSKLDGQLNFDLHGLISSEIDFQDKTLKSILGAKLELTLPAPEKVYTAATFMPFAQSQTFEKMMNDVSSDFYSQWDMAVRTGYLTGDTAQTINRRVLGSLKALQPGTMQKLRNALDSNTRTMLSHYAEQTRNSIYRANEDLFFGYKRLETLDSRTCLVCGALDGKVYKTLDEAPALPAHLNCILGDTLISSGTDVSAVSRRAYEGDIFIIRTSSGNCIRSTPNHPILTDRGFLAAKDIHLGQNLVCDGGINRVGLTGKNDYNVESEIEELFHSFVKNGQMMTEKVPTTSKDFHGDGIDDEITVIACNRKLTNEIDVSFSKYFLKFFFVFRRVACSIFKSCNRSFMQFIRRVWSSFCRFVCSFGKPPYVFRCCSFHSFKLLLTRISHFNSGRFESEKHIGPRNAKSFSNTANADTGIIDFKHFSHGRSDTRAAPRQNFEFSFAKPCIDSLSVDPELACDLINGKAGFVKFDQVVDIRKRYFHGHVYNLQTKGSWFIANNIITHNCRGLYVPLIKGIDNEEGERASVDGPVSAKMSYEDWLKRQSDDVQKDVLGPSRYRLYKNGASLGSFVTDGRTLTLEQWKSVDGNAFPEVIIGRFVPAKSISEANEWALSNLGIKNNSSLELESLNKVNERLFELKNEYQFSIKSIGDEKSPYASASMSRMNFYTKYANDEELLKSRLDKDIANKFHCEGCNTLKSIIDHEFAHTMTIPDLIPGNENDGFLQEIRRIKTMYTRQLHKGSDILISRYASTNNDEFVAEAFAMALNSEKPSPFAKMVLDLIQKKYGRK